MHPELEFALRVLGYVSASHVMSRASLSCRTGRYEETLTADLTDLLGLYGSACADYLRHAAAPARLAVRVWDLHKKAEKAIGADFVVVLRVATATPAGVAHVRKVILVQAKRQDWGRMAYATSTNHVAKATAMLGARGSAADCYFAYYHDPSFLKLSPKSAAWVGGAGLSSWTPGPPNLWFATPKHGAAGFLAYHPSMRIPTFIERSGYRSLAAAGLSGQSLPAEWAWGVGMHGASHFFPGPSGAASVALPSPSTVAASGRPFDEWLVDLADCRVGTNVPSDVEVNRLLVRCCAADDDEYSPSSVVSISAASGSPAGSVPELPSELELQFEASLVAHLDTLQQDIDR